MKRRHWIVLFLWAICVVVAIANAWKNGLSETVSMTVSDKGIVYNSKTGDSKHYLYGECRSIYVSSTTYDATKIGDSVLTDVPSSAQKWLVVILMIVPYFGTFAWCVCGIVFDSAKLGANRGACTCENLRSPLNRQERLVEHSETIQALAFVVSLASLAEGVISTEAALSISITLN